MKKILLTALIAICSVLSTFAQETYEWKYHHFEFSLPESLEVTTNTSDKFVAKNTHMAVTIKPFDCSDYTSKELGEKLVERAKVNGLRVRDSEIENFSGENCEGVYLLGEYKDEDDGEWGLVAIGFSGRSKAVYAYFDFDDSDRTKRQVSKILESFTFTHGHLHDDDDDDDD
ncbi:MAG: hypothetical protein IKQ46_07095, partial [Bacteroidales bacterium]|nr:hypothetical protein [Bacteroidales bacterium]